MLLELDHPAIVPRIVRHPEDPAFALVRMTSAIHVEEYSSRDVGTAAIMQHPIGTTAYRKIGAHLYKEVGGMPLKALENGSDMLATLLGREHFDFGNFMEDIRNDALILSGDPDALDRQVAYLDRPLNRSERRSKSVTSALKSFEKAPRLGSQHWLGPDTDGFAAEWSARFGSFMENVAIVDGIVHVRSFEPCVSLHFDRQGHTLVYGKLAYMRASVNGPRVVGSRGSPLLGDGGRSGRALYFSLNELDLASEVATELGLGERRMSPNGATIGATVVDPDALSSDFLIEESYRIAARTLDLAYEVTNQVAGLSYSGPDDKQRLHGRIHEIDTHADRLAILVSPAATLDADAIMAATGQLFATLPREGEFLELSTDLEMDYLRDGIRFLGVRRDAMPISLDHTPGFRLNR